MEIFPPLESKLNPYPFFTEQRHHHPLAYSEKHKAWAVYRYDDVKRVLSDTETFSSEERSRVLQVPPRPSLISLDPPMHRPFRNLVTQAFTPRAVAALGPRIEAITHDLLDRVSGKGHMDLVADLAYPLPVTVIAELLGVPASDRDRFKDWADRILSGRQPFLTTSKEREQALNEIDDYFREILAERRTHPSDDLISHLLAAEVEGERLSEDEILSFCSLLLLAGHITTVNLITNAMLGLMEHSDALAELRQHPEAIPTAIEESLRHRSPVQFVSRATTREVEIGGGRIPADQMVIAFIASANHDETVFEDPERFDVYRKPNPHMAFGYGIHFCLGAPLARLEGQIALRILLERLPQLAIAPLQEEHAAPYTGKPFEPLDSVFLHGVSRLNMWFQPATPLSP